jgi:hypothetical protein
LPKCRNPIKNNPGHVCGCALYYATATGRRAVLGWKCTISGRVLGFFALKTARGGYGGRVRGWMVVGDLVQGIVVFENQMKRVFLF